MSICMHLNSSWGAVATDSLYRLSSSSGNKRTLLLGWTPSLLGWRPSLVGLGWTLRVEVIAISGNKWHPCRSSSEPRVSSKLGPRPENLKLVRKHHFGVAWCSKTRRKASGCLLSPDANLFSVNVGVCTSSCSSSSSSSSSSFSSNTSSAWPTPAQLGHPVLEARTTRQSLGQRVQEGHSKSLKWNSCY